ncbi:hypothetical protein ACJRO7_012524 [Eucalyptus globulus]|uniref:Uncharacterized protein n=1 Tax=Eucalyptus globulus TaxID=34317 RepID=A0ABD3LN81_EUCGL
MENKEAVNHSTSSTFIQCLNQHVSTTSSNLNLLNSMSIGTDKMYDLERPYQPATVNLGASEVEGPKSVVKASKDEYESLPSCMINSYISKKENCSENKCFFQDEISSLALGPKARSYLLLLAHMKPLVIETVDGLISCRVL